MSFIEAASGRTVACDGYLAILCWWGLQQNGVLVVAEIGTVQPRDMGKDSHIYALLLLYIIVL